MKTKTSHTPTPWKYHLGRGANPRFHIQTEGGHQIVSTPELVRHPQAGEQNAMQEANAAFIVHACNSHEQFLELLRQAAGYISDLQLDHDLADNGILKELNGAIAKAEGK